jgi:hypothetical protein
MAESDLPEGFEYERTPAGPPGETMRWGSASDVLDGVMQGLLDPIEGMVQLAEHAGGHKIAPDSLRNWARDYRKKVQGSWFGQGGEFLGNAATFAIPFAGAARGAAAANTALRAVPAAARAIEGATAAELQPVSGGGDYWKTKRSQAVGGAALGSTLPALAKGAGYVAPWLTRFTAGHMPHWLWNASGGGSLPAVASQAAGAVAPGAVGGVVGEIQGQHPND